MSHHALVSSGVSSCVHGRKIMHLPKDKGMHAKNQKKKDSCTGVWKLLKCTPTYGEGQDGEKQADIQWRRKKVTGSSLWTVKQASER